MTWLLSPNVILAAVLAIGATFVGTYTVMKARQVQLVSAAVDKGEKIGAGAAAAKAAEKAQDTVNKVAEGEAEAPAIPADRTALQELCNRSASCRDRKR